MINKKIIIIFVVVLLFVGVAYATGILFGDKPDVYSGSLHKGLIGHWALDSDGYNSNTERVTDKTPYENHGVNNGATLTTDQMGQSNRAMNFDGTSARITIADKDAWAGPEISMTFWVNTSDTGNQGLFCQDRYNGPCMSMISDRFLMFSNGSGCYKYSGTGYNDGNWHFLVGTVNASGIPCISVDGGSVLCDTPTSCNPLDNSVQPLYVGYSVYGYANASISDVRIYNRVLSTDEIDTLYYSYRPKASSGSLQKGLVFDMPLTSKWTKSETAGSEIMTDRTPYSNNAQNHGATVGSDFTIFDGSNDYMLSSSFGNIYLGKNVTVLAWVKTNISVQKGILQITHTGDNGLVLFTTGTTLRSFIRDLGGLNNYACGALPPDNNWHFVGFYSSPQVRGHIIDGDSTSCSTAGVPYTDSSGSLNIGLNYGYWNGSIGDVRVYNRTLSADEIKLLYDKGR